MSKPLEHDYIVRLSEVTSMKNFSKPNISCGLKTELSLGLPGSESPERKPGFVGVTIFGKELEGNTQNGVAVRPLKGCVFGGKRGFSDAIDGSKKWVLSINGRSEGKLRNDVVVTSSPKDVKEKKTGICDGGEHASAPAAKAQVVGWPPIRSFRKNTMATNPEKNNGDTREKSLSVCLYVKVSMDGAPYLRKVDLQIYRNYMELSSALEKMFNCYIKGQYGGSHGCAGHDGLDDGHSTDNLHSSEYVLTYEDKDGDWMLVGDVPWKMFTENCRKLRIMKGSEAIGLAPKCS